MSLELESQRVYLDHAATSWPKPPGILEALVEYQRNCGAAAGRGTYRSAQAAGQIVESARKRLAKLIGAPDSSQIALVNNGTQSLNLALAGFLREGDHVVTSAIEHNSVLRPLELLRRTRKIEFTVVSCDSSGRVDPESIRNAVRSKTRLIAISHASNVTGAIQPIEAIARIAKENNVRLLVDAAQTLGFLEIAVDRMGIDMLAAPGHKGLCGMLGTGLLYVCQDLAMQIESPWIGGTGVASDDLAGPFSWNSAAESGNLNVPAIASLDAGLSWLETNSKLSDAQRLNQMIQPLLQMLTNRSVYHLVGAIDLHRVPVVSLVCDTMSPHDLAAILDSSFGIEVRAGLHCAARIHSEIGTSAHGGTLRISLGHTSTERDVAIAMDALEQIIG